MIVLGPANDILDETYLVSTESRGYIQEPTEEQVRLPSFPPSFLLLPPVPSLQEVFSSAPLPDLVPQGTGERGLSRSPRPLHFPRPTNPHQGREEILVEMGHTGLQIRDLVHPALCDPLRNQQMTTFKLVKLVSDFNHQLSKIHEQFAEDSAQLVETFRKKTTDILNEGPRCNNSLAVSWDQWMTDVMQDSACHTEMASVLSRAVARPLLEKTFHMKIQSRKVFSLRECFETLLADTEDKLSKSHAEYRAAWTRHVEQQNPASLAHYLDRHNNYVQQIHATNAMIDQYYMESLPLLLQELDDVYHDVAGVVLDSLTEGSNVIAQKTATMSMRWNKTGEIVRKIAPPQDLAAFVGSLSIPEYVPVTKHNFAPPPPKEVTNEIGLPIKTCEVVMDRVVSEAARINYEAIRAEAKEQEATIKLNSDALDTLIRIQAKNLDQQLFNKANEIQEEISRKRYDMRVAQIQLSGLRAQKELFSSKVRNDGELRGGVEGVPLGGPRERKLSTSSTGSIKSKWVKAFKTIKGKGETEKPKNGGPPSAAQPSAENAHIFQEYTYKKITPCDVCSQILRGHTRQGLKCKLCRMNVHPDCQDKVVKCQPKSKLLRRQKSASEVDTRGLDIEDESRGVLSARASVEPSGTFPRSRPAISQPGDTGSLQRSRQAALQTSLSIDSAQVSYLGVGGEGQEGGASPSRRRLVGGSYSKYTALRDPGGGIALLTDGELVDSSGRKIRAPGTFSGTASKAGSTLRLDAVQPRHP